MFFIAKAFHCCLCRLKNDDKLIQAEGVDSLSEDELREDCMERGIVAQHSVEEMRQQVLCIGSLFQ